MSRELIRGPEAYPFGLTPVVRLEGEDRDIGIGFWILRLRAGQGHAVVAGMETAVLPLGGAARMDCGPVSAGLSRRSLFDQDPSALHCPADAEVRIGADTDCELAIFRTPNAQRFPTRLFGPREMVQSEDRGRGLLEDTARRFVRTIFDLRNRPEARLVLGEVITFPGRWSSYPPHHHPQPEIYHYRFTAPQGYGHTELGERVYKVRKNDTLLIREGQDHPQVAAPGYGMYYIWAIRHLPGNPYTVPEFSAEHRWANEPGATYWRALA